jgi:hypothetical protein
MLRTLLAALVGGVLGFGWHRFVGCRGGACVIWANPYVATLYGALLGFLVAR